MGPDRFSWVNPPRVNVTVQVGCSIEFNQFNFDFSRKINFFFRRLQTSIKLNFKFSIFKNLKHKLNIQYSLLHMVRARRFRDVSLGVHLMQECVIVCAGVARPLCRCVPACAAN